MGGQTGRYVVMGVAGSGKSVIGEQLARALDVPFVEGDDLHSSENKRRMAAGIALTDADRHGWLLAIAARLRAAQQANAGLVATCSALKRSYRDLLRGSGDPNTQFIYLAGPRALVAERLAQRRGHFMPASLLDSQFATLEEPAPDEHAWKIDISATPQAIVADLLHRANAR